MHLLSSIILQFVAYSSENFLSLVIKTVFLSVQFCSQKIRDCLLFYAQKAVYLFIYFLIGFKVFQL